MQYLFITRASSIIPPSSTAKEDIFEYPQPVLDMEAMPPEAIEVSAREVHNAASFLLSFRDKSTKFLNHKTTPQIGFACPHGLIWTLKF